MIDYTFKQKTIIANGLLILYFSAILCTTQFAGTAVSLFWKISIVMCAIAGVYLTDFKVLVKWLVIAAIVLTGFLNIFLIESTTIRDQVLIVLFAFTSFVLMSEYINEIVVLLMFLMNVALVSFKFITVGLWGNIYIGATSNFVSVYLLYPLVVYYILMEKKGKDVLIWPACLYWFFCLISRGRGGILVSSFFIIGIVLVAAKKSENKRKLFGLAGVVFLAFLLINAGYIISALEDSVILEYFKDRGFSSGSRIMIWSDYIKKTLSDFGYLLFGTRADETYVGKVFDGNPHNSFICIHMHNGLVMLCIILVYIIRAVLHAIKNRKYTYLICLITFFMRSFTDSIFWPAYGTAVLFFILFVYSDSWKLSNEGLLIKGNE